MTALEFTLRLGVAFSLGTAIGLERQFRQRMAGLRTNALVATGAGLFVSIESLTPHDQNPTQIAAYIVSGVGFLAGAVIFKENMSVVGLNTAATLWGTAAVGTLAGSGAFLEATIGAAFVLAANVLLRPISQAINRRATEGTEVTTSYRISVSCPSASEQAVRALLFEKLKEQNFTLHEIASQDAPDGADSIEIDATFTAPGRPNAKLEKLVAALARDPAVTAASWKTVSLDEETAPLGASE
jgi:putative Mg2+ transporter-C (MgtC) family protein